MCESSKWISQTSNLFGHFDDSTNGDVCQSGARREEGTGWAPALLTAWSSRGTNSKPHSLDARYGARFRKRKAWLALRLESPRPTPTYPNRHDPPDVPRERLVSFFHDSSRSISGVSDDSTSLNGQQRSLSPNYFQQNLFASG